MYLEERHAKCLQKDSDVSHSGLFCAARLDFTPLTDPLCWRAPWTDGSYISSLYRTPASQSFYSERCHLDNSSKQREIPSLQPFPDHKTASQHLLPTVRDLVMPWVLMPSPRTKPHTRKLTRSPGAWGRHRFWGVMRWQQLESINGQSEYTLVFVCYTDMCDSLWVTHSACKKCARSFAFSHSLIKCRESSSRISQKYARSIQACEMIKKKIKIC